MKAIALSSTIGIVVTATHVAIVSFCLNPDALIRRPHYTGSYFGEIDDGDVGYWAIHHSSAAGMDMYIIDYYDSKQTLGYVAYSRLRSHKPLTLAMYENVEIVMPLLNDRPGASFIVCEQGWPIRTSRGIYDIDLDIAIGGIVWRDFQNPSPGANPFSLGLVATRPIWVPWIGYSLAIGFVFWIMLSTIIHLRSVFRRNAGRCVRCGYILEKAQVHCSECGSSRV